MPTRQEIIDNNIIGCPKHADDPPIDLGVCEDCDKIAAVWAEEFGQFSKDCETGKIPPLVLDWSE